MSDDVIPEKLEGLHFQEEQLRQKALTLAESNDCISLHLSVVENAMDLAEALQQFKTDDEDMRIIQILGMRMFNALGASLKLAFSGYIQNAALIMRDILETVFLLNLFRIEHDAIRRWRIADKRERFREFSPVKVRNALDEHDGFEGEKRAKYYAMFSELAGHPNMNSILMMRPSRDGDAVIGPFIELTSLEAVLSEMGCLAIQVGEQLDAFFPQKWACGKASRDAFARMKLEWINKFYPQPEFSKDK